MQSFNQNESFLCRRDSLFIAAIILFSLIMFYPLLIAGHCLFTTDDNFGMVPFIIKEPFPSRFLGQWVDMMFYGWPGGVGQIVWNPIIMALLPALFGFNWIHAIDLVLASIFLFFFLRVGKLSRPAIALAILTVFWLGSNLTLTYAGHLGKFGALMFAAASLYGIRKTFDSDRPWLWSVVTGGALGFMLIQQQDLALFFGLFLGPYALFRARFLFQKGMWRKGLLLLVPMGVVALLMSGATLIASYAQNVGPASAQQEDDPRQKWEFTTQWSWPPEESIDFIAPGYMGWRSGETEGPYWGRMGRSAGWEKTGQGFMNFKLENQYLGAIPVIFALFAVLIVCLRSDFKSSFSSRPENARPGTAVFDCKCVRAEVLFWFCVAVITLLLSFGKYFPLYQLFYQLPLVSNIRNPNKFLQIFQLAVGILAAYGAHLAFNWRINGKTIARVIFTSLVIVGLSLGTAGCGPARTEISYGELLAHLNAPDYPARIDVPETAIITSFDPTGGNNDFNHPLRPGPEGWVVLADLKGPGYVSRFWFTGSDIKHRLRFFFDNERKPRLDVTIKEFCGELFPFRPPLAAYESYSFYNYVPIPYAKRLVIMTQKGGAQPDGGPKLFYQINYNSLPPTSRVESFNLKLAPEDEKALGEIVARWKNIESFKCDAGELVATNIEISAGGKQSALLPDGPATIRELIIKPAFEILPGAAQRRGLLRDVILKIYWDGQAEPSVAVPFGGFFGSVWRKTSFGSIFFGMTNDSFYCRFPMPYRAQAAIAFENQTTNAVGFNLTVKGERGPVFLPQYGFFHADWRRTTDRDIGRPHTVLNTSGRGRFAGCILSALALDKSFWLLEGDEIMTRDNEFQPFWRGTGLEDYFNGGWYYQNVVCHPLHGLLFKSFFRTVQYRVHLPEPVLFKNKFNMIFERGPDNNSRGWMESTAFYYLDQPRAAGSELLSSADRRPPVDEPQSAGFMLDLFNCERFGDYREAIDCIDIFLEQYPASPFADTLNLRKAAYLERISGIEKARPMYEKIMAETKDAAVKEQAGMLLRFHERTGNAILGLYANTPARCFLDGQLAAETSHPAKLTTVGLELKPGRHVLAIQCRYHPYPAWVQACLRTHSGAVITEPSWKQCVDPSGNWTAADYDDGSWQITGGTGNKGPPEEPFVWIEPNAFIDMQSLAVGVFCTIPWPDKTKTLVFRRVFEIPQPAADGK